MHQNNPNIALIPTVTVIFIISAINNMSDFSENNQCYVW